MKTGTVVKYRYPINSREAGYKFRVIEDRGDRCVIIPIGNSPGANWKIVPQEVVSNDDLKKA